jgi:TRAP-type mannitol/chloroaromatic compound transport system permease small subunit
MAYLETFLEFIPIACCLMALWGIIEIISAIAMLG